MEVTRQVKVEVHEVSELSNEEVHAKRWARGMIDKREGAARKEGKMWRHGLSEGSEGKREGRR